MKAQQTTDLTLDAPGWAKQWRQAPDDIARHLDTHGWMLRTATGKALRLLWTTLEDLKLEHSEFVRLARQMTQWMAGPDQGPERIDILIPLVAGNSQDIEQMPQAACVAWDISSAWACERWTPKDLERTLPIIPNLMGISVGSSIVMNHILSSLAQRLPEGLIARQDWVWDWMEKAYLYGAQMEGNIAVLARFGVPLNFPHRILPIEHAAEQLDQARIADQHGRSWRNRRPKTRDCVATLNLLVQYGADWKALEERGVYPFAVKHLQNHPKVRAEKLRALLPTLKHEDDARPAM